MCYELSSSSIRDQRYQDNPVCFLELFEVRDLEVRMAYDRFSQYAPGFLNVVLSDAVWETGLQEA